MSGPRILVTGGRTPSGFADRLRDAAPGAVVEICADQAAMEAAIDEAEIVATHRISADALARAGRLRWIQSWAAGPDALLIPELVTSDITVTSCRGNGAVPLAEHAMMLMLMLDRQAARSLDAQARHDWERFYLGELAGRTCLIIGTGHSGADLARKAQAFHMRVLGVSRNGRPVEGFDHVTVQKGLRDLLPEADFIVVTAPLTDATRGMIDADAFARMKRGAVYICFSRGGIADDDALIAALRDGQLAGAGLDAHSVEPLPQDSPFWSLPNVIVTPHHGALTDGTRARGHDIFVENLRRYSAGEALRNLVDKQAGY